MEKHFRNARSSDIILVESTLRKRKRISNGPSNNETFDPGDRLDETDQGVALAEVSGKRQRSEYFQGLRLPDLVSPKSIYHGYIPSLPISQEDVLLKEVLVGSIELSVGL